MRWDREQRVQRYGHLCILLHQTDIEAALGCQPPGNRQTPHAASNDDDLQNISHSLPRGCFYTPIITRSQAPCPPLGLRGSRASRYGPSRPNFPGVSRGTGFAPVTLWNSSRHDLGKPIKPSWII